jgi:hypothetical protein
MGCGPAAQVAQLVEHATENRSVGGSIPPLGTIFWLRPPGPRSTAMGDKVEAAYRRGDLLDKRQALMDDWAAYLAARAPQGDQCPGDAWCARCRGVQRRRLAPTGKRLRVPDNISLLALPPYSPELNPMENIWDYLRGNKLSRCVWDSYQAIVAACKEAWLFVVGDPLRVESIAHRLWHVPCDRLYPGSSAINAMC